MKTSMFLRRAVVAAAVTASLALAVPPAGAALPERDNDCLHPTSGVSFNELFDVPEQFVLPFCDGFTAGEHWRPASCLYRLCDGAISAFARRCSAWSPASRL